VAVGERLTIRAAGAVDGAFAGAVVVAGVVVATEAGAVDGPVDVAGLVVVEAVVVEAVVVEAAVAAATVDVAAIVVTVALGGVGVVVGVADFESEPQPATASIAHAAAINQRCFIKHPPLVWRTSVGAVGRHREPPLPRGSGLRARLQATGLVVAGHEPPLRVSAGFEPDFADSRAIGALGQRWPTGHVSRRPHRLGNRCRPPDPSTDRWGRSRSSSVGRAAASRRSRSSSGVATATTSCSSPRPTQPTTTTCASGIERHRAERPRWPTVDAPCALAEAVRTTAAGSMIIIDCLTVWLANLLVTGVADLASPARAVIDGLVTRPGPSVVVSNEVGMGGPPGDRARTALPRRPRPAQPVVRRGGHH